MLLLRDEKWEFVSEEQDKTPDVASEISPKPRGRGRKGRGSSVQLKEGNAETPKSGGGDLPKKGVVRKVPAMVHPKVTSRQLQANQRGKLQGRMTMRHLRLAVTLRRKLKKDPKTKPLSQLRRQRMICLRMVATRVPVNQRRLAAEARI